MKNEGRWRLHTILCAVTLLLGITSQKLEDGIDKATEGIDKNEPKAESQNNHDVLSSNEEDEGPSLRRKGEGGSGHESEFKLDTPEVPIKEAAVTGGSQDKLNNDVPMEMSEKVTSAVADELVTENDAIPSSFSIPHSSVELSDDQAKNKVGEGKLTDLTADHDKSTRVQKDKSTGSKIQPDQSTGSIVDQSTGSKVQTDQSTDPKVQMLQSPDSKVKLEQTTITKVPVDQSTGSIPKTDLPFNSISNTDKSTHSITLQDLTTEPTTDPETEPITGSHLVTEQNSGLNQGKKQDPGENPHEVNPAMDSAASTIDAPIQEELNKLPDGHPGLDGRMSLDQDTGAAEDTGQLHENLAGSHDQQPDVSHDQQPVGSHDQQPDVSHDQQPDGSHHLQPDVSHDQQADGSHDMQSDRSQDQQPDGSHDQQPDGSHDQQPDGSQDQDLQPPGVGDEQAQLTTVSPPTRDAEEEDILSFDEWKQKRLAEHEEEKNKQLEAQSSGSDGAPSPHKSKVKPSKNKGPNVASASCGAKILATNSETQNPAYLLTENKDQYLINPCKAKKWFVVELCEPVKVQSLEMGNLELFSSLPEKFVAYTSERYPSKDMKMLGSFTATDDRSVQNFDTGDDSMFAKFIKIDIQSHYGVEHFCTLSILRVFGVTVEEEEGLDEEDTLDEAASDVEMEGGKEAGDLEQPTNIFASAKDTVMNIVKNVLNPSRDEEDKAAGDGKTNQSEPEGQNKVNNVSANLTASEANQTLPCTPDASVNSSDQHDRGSQGPSRPETPSIPITDPPSDNTPDGADKEVDVEVPLVSIMEPEEDSEPMPPSQSDIVTLIERPLATPPFLHCHAPCHTPTARHHCLYQGHKCVYASLFYRPITCATDSHLRLIFDLSGRTDGAVEAGVGSSALPSVPHTVTAEDISTGGMPISISPSPSIALPSELDAQVEEATLPATPHCPHLKPSSDMVHVHSQSHHSGSPVEATPTTSQCLSASTATPGVESQVSGELSRSDVVPSIPLFADPGDAGGGVPGKSENTGGDQEHDEATRQPEKGEISVKDETPRQPEKGEVPVKDEPAKMSSRSKESLLMRLKNRVSDLELNLNLSSKYFEELNRRYKRQIEEINKSLEKTMGDLKDSSQAADSMFAGQQQHIVELERRLSNMTDTVNSMQLRMTTLHVELIERHLVLMLVEAMVFMVALTWCMARQHRQLTRRHHAHPAPVTPATESIQTLTAQKADTSHYVKDSVSKAKSHNRAASFDATQRHGQSSMGSKEKSAMERLRTKSGSENDLTVIEPHIPVFSQVPDLPQRSKKKRRKLAGNPLSSSHLVGQHLQNTASPPTSFSTNHCPAAGVIFTGSPSLSSCNGSPEAGVRRYSHGGEVDTGGCMLNGGTTPACHTREGTGRPASINGDIAQPPGCRCLSPDVFTLYSQYDGVKEKSAGSGLTKGKPEPWTVGANHQRAGRSHKHPSKERETQIVGHMFDGFHGGRGKSQVTTNSNKKLSLPVKHSYVIKK